MRRVPPQQGNTVDDCFRQEAPLPIAGHADLNPEALGKLLAFLVQEEGQVSELRRFNLQHAVEKKVLGCGWEPLLATNHMAYLHGVVVHDVCEVVSWVPIVLQDDLVVNLFVIEDDLAMHDVPERRLALRHFHSNDVRFSVCFLFLNLLLSVVVQAESVVLCLRIFLSANLDAHLLQSLRCTETRVSITVFYECIDVFVVDWQSFALKVWTVRPHRLATIFSILCLILLLVD